jgi:hypothetical protein
MRDDRVYDAINLFKHSPTAHGTGQIGGDAAYRARYRRLAKDIVAKLWELWATDEIGFADLGHNLVGDSLTGRLGHDIRVNRMLEPSLTASIYSNAVEQGKLAAFSCNIAHEATHLVRHIDAYPEEEVLCRTIQLFYFRDLKQGRSYRSRVTGSTLTARYTATTPFYNTYLYRLNRLASHDLIDNVFSIREYRRDLEESQTAEFISRSLSWWGGLHRRWPSTRGYYLRSLGSQTRQDYALKILEILESISHSQWPAARSCAGDLQKIRDGLRAGYHIYNNQVSRRIQRVQENLGASLGVQPRP